MPDKQTSSTIKEYISEIYEDVELTDFNIKDVQLKLPAIKHKYVSRLILHKRKRNQLISKKITLKKKIANEIKNNNVYNVSNPVAEKTAEDHNSIISINSDISEQELIIQLLEKTERTLSSMTYDVKNIIELMKLEVT
jgi:hypothetical protein